MRVLRFLPMLASGLLLLASVSAQAADGARPGVVERVDPNRFGGEHPADPAYGAFQRGFYKTAYDLALPRAENGDPNAQTLVAEILARGLGVRRNDAEAAQWYGKAAAQKVPDAQFQYALLLLDGRVVPKDRKAAFGLMQAAADAGNRLAQFNFAQLIVSEERGEPGLAKAAPYYRRAADGGLADAQYAYAQLLANGTGGVARDEAAARRWLLLAARQNYDTAELDLGSWLVEGRGGSKEEKKGYAWLLRAARAGNIAAQSRTAKLLMSGIGTEPDNIGAAAWYFTARRAGLRDPALEDLLNGLTDDEQKQALDRANNLR